MVAEDVDLQEPGAVGRCSGDVGRARGREGREAERRAGRCRGPGKALLPIRVGHALIGNRRHDDGRGDGVAEHGRPGRRRLDPAEHALSQVPRGERGDVRAKRPLGSGAACEELTPVGVHPREARASTSDSVSGVAPPHEPTSLGDGPARSDPGRAGRAASPARAPAPLPRGMGRPRIRARLPEGSDRFRSLPAAPSR